MDKDVELMNRRIAADLLVVLLGQGLIKPSGASKQEAVIIADTTAAYAALLAGIHSVKRE